ncbi:MAG: hypothetical protein LBE96_21845, partial [Kalamiella piersonii]|uniref:hypothetical protein n=1 Tax=Pantoea piersonii TaxID=2364647 RepID=UPI00242B1A3A
MTRRGRAARLNDCPINPIEINPCATDSVNGDFCGAASQYRMLFQQLSALSGRGHSLGPPDVGNGPNLLIVFYVQIMPDDFIMQL